MNETNEGKYAEQRSPSLPQNYFPTLLPLPPPSFSPSVSLSLSPLHAPVLLSPPLPSFPLLSSCTSLTSPPFHTPLLSSPSLPPSPLLSSPLLSSPRLLSPHPRLSCAP